MRAERAVRYVNSGQMNDRALAITFAAAMQGREAGISVVGRPLLPSLILPDLYFGEQDGAV